MTHKRPIFPLLLISVFCCSSLMAQEARVELNAQIVDATQTFLDSLTREQHNQTVFEFDDEERLNWHFIPRERSGAVLRDMTEEQLLAAHSVLQTLFSASGYSQAEAVRNLENVLAEIEVNGMFERDPDLYYLSVFGEPGMDSQWALRYEGHHLAFNWTFVRGLGIASTPQFFGSNPAEVRSGSLAGTRVLAAEEDLARELLASFTVEQASQAIIDSEAPRDILTGAQQEIVRLEDSGISGREMSSQQQRMLLQLITEVSSVQASPIHFERMSQIRSADLNNVRFTWIGSTERGAPHYYRVQGVNFLIEYDNVQNDANHVHLVWRDFGSDFGRDLLQLHYDSVAAANGPGHNH